MQIFHNPNYNFIRWRWHAIALSAAVIIAGIAMIATRGVPLGIDFSGGTLVRVQFEQAVSEDQVRQALNDLPGDKIVQQFGPAAGWKRRCRKPGCRSSRFSCATSSAR
jgi:preprotein translocase subunit SecF